jgi:hypothetical protein
MSTSFRPSKPEIPEIGKLIGSGVIFDFLKYSIYTVLGSDGYLDKLKHKATIFGSWNKRYFRCELVIFTLVLTSEAVIDLCIILLGQSLSG